MSAKFGFIERYLCHSLTNTAVLIANFGQTHAAAVAISSLSLCSSGRFWFEPFNTNGSELFDRQEGHHLLLATARVWTKLKFNKFRHFIVKDKIITLFRTDTMGCNVIDKSIARNLWFLLNGSFCFKFVIGLTGQQWLTIARNLWSFSSSDCFNLGSFFLWLK